MKGIEMEFQHHHILTGAVNMHAVTMGSGPPLVVLHGFPQTWWAWRRMMPLLAENFTVVAVDLRGAGNSSCPYGGYDKATLANDVHNVMLALGHPRYAVCGHDIGGMVSLALAATHREAVTHFAVMDVPLPGWSKWERIFADPRVWHFAFHSQRGLPERLMYDREYDYISTFILDRAVDFGAHSHEDMEVYARAFAMPARTTSALEWYRAFPTDHANALEWKKNPLTMPALALGGERRWGPEIVEMVGEFAPGAVGGSIANCNHWLMEERPVEIADRLLRFLKD